MKNFHGKWDSRLHHLIKIEQGKTEKEKMRRLTNPEKTTSISGLYDFYVDRKKNVVDNY
jgi:hypothetical protein